MTRLYQGGGLTGPMTTPEGSAYLAPADSNGLAWRIVIDGSGAIRSLSHPSEGRFDFSLGSSPGTVEVPEWWSPAVRAVRPGEPNELASPAATTVDWTAMLDANAGFLASLETHIGVDRITGVKPQSLLASHCRSEPYMPATMVLPAGAVFLCQVNLADVPRGVIADLPERGLLQFFSLPDFGGHVRFVDLDLHDGADHDRNLAAAAIGAPDDAFLDPELLTFKRVYEMPSNHPFLGALGRAQRYLGDLAVYSPYLAGLPEALAARGIVVADLSEDSMGLARSGNGETPKGFTNLLTIDDNVGYYYWHIPSEDLAVKRFDRAEGSWTD